MADVLEEGRAQVNERTDSLIRDREAVRKLPAWVLDGAEVTDMTYRVIAHAFSGGDQSVHGIAAALNVDEADVLRAWAEIKAVQDALPD